MLIGSQGTILSQFLTYQRGVSRGIETLRSFFPFLLTQLQNTPVSSGINDKDNHNNI